MDNAAARGFRALISPPVWDALVQGGARKPYSAGDRLLSQGERGGWLVIMVNGRVKVLYSEPAGAELLLAVRGPGDILGELSGRDDGPRSASIVAMEPCIGYTWTEQRFTEFVRQHRLGPQLDRYVTAKFRQSSSHAWKTAHQRTSTRLAELIREVLAAAGPDRPSRQVPMSQEEMAVALGVVRSSVARIIADWKRAGLVSTGRAQLTVLDPQRLWATEN